MMILSRYIDLASIKSGPKALVSTGYCDGGFCKGRRLVPAGRPKFLSAEGFLCAVPACNCTLKFSEFVGISLVSLVSRKYSFCKGRMHVLDPSSPAVLVLAPLPMARIPNDSN